MTKSKNPEIKIEIHPLAQNLPEMNSGEFETLKKSIQDNGQREKGILLDGKILDGRHRHKACKELGIPFDFRPYDKKHDGLIPEMLVADANIARRHLTPSQLATVGAELAEKIAEEKAKLTDAPAAKPEDQEGDQPKEEGRSSKIAADKVGVSQRSVDTAKKLKKEDPVEFGKVKSGEKTLNQASTEATMKKAREDESRQHTADALEAHHPESFIEAIRDGIVLKTPGQLKEFTKLEIPDQKSIKDMICKGWTVARAMAYVKDDLTMQSTISDLVNKAIGTESKTHYSDQIGGWEVTATKI